MCLVFVQCVCSSETDGERWGLGAGGRLRYNRKREKEEKMDRQEMTFTPQKREEWSPLAVFLSPLLSYVVAHTRTHVICAVGYAGEMRPISVWGCEMSYSPLWKPSPQLFLKGE